jgi:hypothetical protein
MNWSVFLAILAAIGAFASIETILEATGRGLFQPILDRLDRIEGKLDAILQR